MIFFFHSGYDVSIIAVDYFIKHKRIKQSFITLFSNYYRWHKEIYCDNILKEIRTTVQYKLESFEKSLIILVSETIREFTDTSYQWKIFYNQNIIDMLWLHVGYSSGW